MEHTNAILDAVRLVISICGLLSLFGTVCLFLSLRAASFGQTYQRWQNLTLWLAEHPDVYEEMKTRPYRDGVATPHLFAASAMLNYYEEAYHLNNHKVFIVAGKLFPKSYFASVKYAQRYNMQTLLYLRTYWQSQQHRFADEFNRYVRVDLGIAEETVPAEAVLAAPQSQHA